MKVIRTQKEHRAALLEIENLMLGNPKRRTPAAERLELLAVLVEAYERQRFPIAAPTPLEAIRFRMEHAGLTQADLARLFGSRSHACEVLRGKRQLSLSMIRALRASWGISADVLIGAPAAGKDGGAA